MDNTKHDNLMEIGKGAYGALLDLLADYENPYRHHTDNQVHQLLNLEDDEEITDDHREQLADEDPEQIKDDAEQAIHDDPLEITYRSGWFNINDGMPEKPEEFCVLLTTGGPAVRIMGELDEHGNITRAYMQVQDWGTAWTDYYQPGIKGALMRYCEIIGVGQF
jgi:hypothetical protein